MDAGKLAVPSQAAPGRGLAAPDGLAYWEALGGGDAVARLADPEPIDGPAGSASDLRSRILITEVTGGRHDQPLREGRGCGGSPDPFGLMPWILPNGSG